MFSDEPAIVQRRNLHSSLLHRYSIAMKKLAPMVTLQGLRIGRGLTAKTLAAQLHERGVDITERGLLNAEGGHTGISKELLTAWCAELGVSARDVRLDSDVREQIGELDEANAA
jgi:transcriptional regulator with XRE-family HTH domain